ncbi:hypothetical protein UC35_04850 [Ramlibacter tataouinensis]|uniref:Phospholipase n=1 Tax=Ramlibacter tataouinensis TaxID=94132 RepID=A0A127JQW9_9BURK|nr:hypothetical protein UC35_04850 [Ramlibacter tataouinensis]
MTGPGAAPAPSGPPMSGVSRVIVAGDSLADVGTFGIKFTVQDAASPAGFPIFPELVGAAYGLSAMCSHYMDNGASGVIARGNLPCTNFAVGGGRLLRGEGPQGIPFQLQDAAVTVGGRFGAGDLVLVNGGGNDASDLAAAYLVGVSSRSGMLAFLAFLAREVEVDALVSTAPGDASLARSANLYMEKAADVMADAVVAHALDRGATRVTVLNLPDITLTPRFSAAFEKLVQERGVDEATVIQGVVRQTVGAFNARLQSRLGSDGRVVLVDVRAAVDDQIAHAAAWGLSDAIHAACPVTSVSSAGLPEWSLPTCTSASLDAVPGTAPGWWTTWAFADGFHPTPTGHRLLAGTVTQALAAASP